MIKQVVFVCFLLSTGFSVSGQSPDKHIVAREQLWLGVLNQTRFSKHWGGWLEMQYRTTDNFVGRPYQFLFRPGLTYFIRDNLRANFGYALVRHYPAEGFSVTRTEHRPWQQVWWNQKYPGLSTLQWIRLEQRFNEKVSGDVKEDGYNYNFRIRYNLAFMIPLKGKELGANIPFAVIANEVFVNLGDRIVYNTFDQNRFFVGFGYNFTSHTNAQFGYMNVYQQERSGHDYVSSHVLRLFLFHSLDLSNKEQ